MKWSNKVNNNGDRWNYQILKADTAEIKQKTVDLIQHFVVPWELTDDDTKKWHLNH